LEAAHITPYKGARTSVVENGLLLRGDIHTLYDLYLIAIDPETLTIRVSERLRNTEYLEFEGRPLGLRDINPSSRALSVHYKEFLMCSEIYRERDAVT
jgi:predicted restriction endonuclease